jgi:hypothetical protein
MNSQTLSSTKLGADWAKRLGRREAALRSTVAVECPLEAGVELYEALARGRAEGARTVVAPASPEQVDKARALGLAPLADTPAGTSYFAGVIEDVLHRTFVLASPADRAKMVDGFPKQIEDRLARHVTSFYEGAWARAVLDRKLSVRQYVITLQNMHQYVRFTTRLLGRAVACSATTPLRAHFAKHLAGEVNHEILIERDLEKLGESVAYLRDERYANPATRAFMVLEQSMVSFECDPVLFAACPLAAEGISAHMDRAFLEALRENVGRGSADLAKKATVFFSSHIETDGGDDGHWAFTMNLLKDHLADERKLGEFLTILELAAESFTMSFNANVADYQLFSMPG